MIETRARDFVRWYGMYYPNHNQPIDWAFGTWAYGTALSQSDRDAILRAVLSP